MGDLEGPLEGDLDPDLERDLEGDLEWDLDGDLVGVLEGDFGRVVLSDSAGESTGVSDRARTQRGDRDRRGFSSTSDSSQGLVGLYLLLVEDALLKPDTDLWRGC